MIDFDTATLEIPLPMRQAPRWLVHLNKIPHYANGSKRHGKLDTQSDWSRLVSFEDALKTLESGRYSGLGFALGPDGSGAVWQGIDLDHVDERPELELLSDGLPGYVERSPSGSGLHAIGYGQPFKTLGSNKTGIEAYAGGRYFTVTSHAIGGDVCDLSEYVGTVLAPRHAGAGADRRPPKLESVNATSAPTDSEITPDTAADLRSAIFHLRADDRDLWVRMGMALRTLGDVGRGLWLDWSATSEKFDPADAARVWESFQRSGLTHRAVFAEAAHSGWTNPKSRKAAPRTAAPRKPAPRTDESTATVVNIVRETDWRDTLIVRAREHGEDKILCRTHNLIAILTHAHNWAGRVRLNTFSGRIAVDGADIDDVGPLIVKAELEREWIEERVPTGDVHDALSVVASRQPFHPVREYLESMEWDGVERISAFFEDFCGCPRDDYHIAVAKSFFVSAVARIFNPGCKVDTMVILESAQGLGKTKLWLALFGDWLTEVTASLSDKDFYTGLRGFWAIDFSELDAFSKSETTQIKRIVTSQSDTYRPHYGRTSQTFPRQCVFVGGTNRDDWNMDPTGARRFLPVRVRNTIDVDAVTNARDQLWAEAVALFQSGASWWEIPDAQAHQDDSYQGDPWDEPVSGFLVGREQVTVGLVLGDALRIEPGKQTRGDQMRVSAILKRSGWERKRDGRGWVYRKKRE